MKNIVLVGFMGTGKSAVGRLLARRLKARFVDLDERITKEAGRSIPEIFATEGEASFRERESKAVSTAAQGTGQIIAAGGGVMLDEKNVERLKSNGILICLTARPEVILSRTLSSLPARPLLNGSNPRERIEELLALRAPFYAKAHTAFDTSDKSIEAVTQEILAFLHEHS